MFQTSLGVLLSGETMVVGETEWVGGPAVGYCFCKETENEVSVQGVTFTCLSTKNVKEKKQTRTVVNLRFRHLYLQNTFNKLSKCQHNVTSPYFTCLNALLLYAVCFY